jgi:cytochrome c-type biogenesis protein
LSGRSVAITNVEAQTQSQRWVTFGHGLAFVLGFSAVFITLGVAASAVGGLLYFLRTWLAKIGGIVVVLFGLHMVGILRIPFLEYDLRPQSTADQQRSFVSSALLGIFFSAGWSPCVGPVLGAILTLALNGGSITRGVQLLSAYSAGLAIPFLLAAVGIGWVSLILSRYRKVMHYAEIVMGGVLIIVGVMLFLGTFEQLSRFGFFVNFGL